MAVVTLIASGMTCRQCVRTVTARLRDLPGVEIVQADAITSEVVVHGEVTDGEVRRALAAAGYPAGGRQS